ncbi:integrator complex subunit 5 [Holotrichia oblita]|uniref:Integrator complex subunit 5 n=1 Tax=Holotrichia oblita TaxID=644536 RepID=A0ACB9T5A3_HOLOL|nr:integrator complex subunit 5 [Holotrichia oblita]
MVSQQTRFRNTTQQDVLSDLKVFVDGVTKQVKCNPLDLTKTALSILKSLPAARDAVLSYFCSVFDKASENYVCAIEVIFSTEVSMSGTIPPLSEYDEEIISEIHSVLCSFVTENANFGLLLSALGLSNQCISFALKIGLNETLQLWMNCRATRTLIDITTQCLSCLIHSDTEACINALLDTSVKHSPNFDWVVAHVGSCFPNTGCNSPKLKSVVGILGHLASSHCSDIGTALLHLFNSSLIVDTAQDNDAIRLQKKATIPFLLHLSNLSSTLLSTICTNIYHTIPLEVILQLYNFIDDWCKYFGSSEALEDLLVSLILKCEKGASQIINLLLDCIFLEDVSSTDEVQNQIIKMNARDVLGTKSKHNIEIEMCINSSIAEFVLQEIDFSIRNNLSEHHGILNSLMNEIDDIHVILLNPKTVKSQTAAKIIIFIGHNNPAILIKSAKFLFQNARTDHHLALLVRILSDELIDKALQPYHNKGGYFAAVLDQIFNEYLQELAVLNDNEDDFSQMWYNLLILLRWEKSNKVQMLRSQIITRALQQNLITFTAIFAKSQLDNKTLHTFTEILEILNIPTYNNGHSYSPPLQVVINFTIGIVNYFFVCCEERDEIIRLKGYNCTVEILKRLCAHSNIARILALRELVEIALFSNCNVLFGAHIKRQTPHEYNDKLLLKQNKKLSKTIPLTKHSSVYNGGIIGAGKRKSISFHSLAVDNIANNTTHLIRTIKACCLGPPDSEKETEVLQDNIIQVSLLLVQYISPDVMYNGLPWPEEEFSKVTIERDLFIRRLFSSTPLLWELMSLVAVHRPALCYCSVIIRALTATLMHQWSSMGDQSKSMNTDSYKSLMETTVKVIEVMSLGQLLPPPLSGIRDAISYFNSFEIVAILRDCIWSYMRDHIPSPALFTTDSNGLHWRDPTIARPPEIYTNTLRIIMQRNIKTVGHLYAQMFINIPKDE